MLVVERNEDFYYELFALDSAFKTLLWFQVDACKGNFKLEILLETKDFGR